MKDHQRYFPLVDRRRQLLPMFASSCVTVPTIPSNVVQSWQ
ncbi:MAG: hypothetical protein ACLTJ8_00350 [Veillonella atypica]